MKGLIPVLVFSCGLYLATLTSCQKEYLIPEDVLIPDTVSFSANVIPIFEESCVSGCHETGKTSPDLTPANAYESLLLSGLVDTTIDPALNVLYVRMISSSAPMPPPSSGGNLPDAKIELVLKWIEQGARNN